MSFFIPLSSPIFWNSNHLAAISLKDLHVFLHPFLISNILKLQSSCCHISNRSIYFFIPLTKSIFIYNNTTYILQHTIIHCPSFPHSIILKLHHFCYSKHISISFFISHTKSPFLESNIINVMTQKTTLAAALATFNLHIIYLALPYILQTYSPQNTHTYLSCTFKFHVSQSIYIYIYIYKRSMSNKVSTYNSHTYYKYHISQYIHISYLLHTS